jgi:RNA 2',3'-cyclic 3'-phosphodiesterase
VRMGAVNVFDRAGALVVDVALTEELMALQKRVAEMTRKCGFVPEERTYHPHITLARAKGDGRRQLKELKSRIETVPKLSMFIANEFLLYESHLGPGGSKYEVQGRFPLSKC